MKLSIVTINYNDAEGLLKTMGSVIAQTCKEFEYIVVDGASTDGSVDVIKELENERVRELGTFKWISEKDSGIYEAMNKGVKMAKGEYVMMLNSADCFTNEHVVERVLPELDGTDIVQGNLVELQSNGKIRNRGYGRSDINYADVFAGHFPHQASFCRHDLFERYGYFDETYRICGDTKFFMTCLGLYNASFKYVDIDITDYDCTGISSMTSGEWFDKHNEELIRLRKEIFPYRLWKYIYENDKKIKLYDKLHEHRWIWYIAMVGAHLYKWLYEKREKFEVVD